MGVGQTPEEEVDLQLSTLYYNEKIHEIVTVEDDFGLEYYKFTVENNVKDKDVISKEWKRIKNVLGDRMKDQDQSIADIQTIKRESNVEYKGVRGCGRLESQARSGVAFAL